MLIFSLRGMKPLEEPIIGRTVINVMMEPEKTAAPDREDGKGRHETKPVYDEVFVMAEEASENEVAVGLAYDRVAQAQAGAYHKAAWHQQPYVEQNTESYAGISENGYRDPLREPYSTFSIDVDNASYSNVRRFINLGQEVPADAVRIEEMINYFKYDYPEPAVEHPFSVYTEAGVCPWNKNRYLLHVGLRAKNIDRTFRYIKLKNSETLRTRPANSAISSFATRNPTG